MRPLGGRRCLGVGRLGGDGISGGGSGARPRLTLRPLLLGLALRRLLRPLLVELDAPLALGILLQPKLGAEGPAGPRAKAGDRLLGGCRISKKKTLKRELQQPDQLLRHRHRQALAGFLLPDHEAAAGVLARPARVALAVLADLALADRAGAEPCP